MADFNVTISDSDMKALEHDLIDVNQWLQEAVAGKISNCKKRMISEWQPKLFADPAVDNIHADENAFINLVVSRDDYKNRSQRTSE